MTESLYRFLTILLDRAFSVLFTLCSVVCCQRSFPRCCARECRHVIAFESNQIQSDGKTGITVITLNELEHLLKLLSLHFLTYAH